MSDVRRVGRLEIEENHEAQSNDWRAQRIGWALILLLVLMGALGVFGRGPLSQATATSGHGDVSIEYERFARVGAPSKVSVALASPASATRIAIRRDYLDRMNVERVSPRPTAVRIEGTLLEYSFDLSRGSGGSPRVVFDLQPARVGIDDAVMIVDDRTITFRQLVYP